MALTRVSGGILQQPIDVGIITATSIQVGSGTTIHDAGIDLGSGNITSHNINSTGIVTSTGLDVNGNGDISGDLSVSGNVSIGGTLTYEDVTNIDSVGIITARDGIHVTGGSVGIGTDNPNAILHVEKDGTSQVLARFESNMGTNNNRSIALSSPTSDSGSEPFIFNTGNGYQFQTDDQVALHINYNRNIGIGTDNPGSNKLQVQGGSALYGNGGASAIWGDTSYLGALTFDGSAQPVIRTASSKSLIFQVNQSTEALRITSTGGVGIGTDNPTSNLTIAEDGASTNAELAINYTGSGNRTSAIRFQRGGTNYGYIAGAAFMLTTGAQDDLAIAPVSGKNLLFGIGNSEKLRITSAGKVGIGTDTPGAVLEVFDATSNTIVNVKSGDSGAVLNLIDDSARSSIEQNGTTLKIISDTGAEYASSDIRLQVDGSTKMRITSGDVNIPGGILNLGTIGQHSAHINSPELMSFNIDTDNDDTNRYFIFNKDSGTNSGTELMRLTEGGNLGIGGVDPATGDGGNSNYNDWDIPKLHVKGPSTSSKFHLLGRFHAGNDADATGAQIVIHHENDRGMALQGGRSSGNRSYGAIKSLDNLARESNVMVFTGGDGQGVDNIKFFTNGLSTGTNERMAINTYGTVHTGGSDLITQTTLKPDLITRAGVISPLFWRPFGGLTSGPSTSGPGYVDLGTGGVRHNLTDPHLGAGLGGSQFQGGLINSYSQTFSNTASGTTREKIEWNRFRILFRGVCPGSGYTVSTVKFRYSTYHYTNGWQDHAGTEWTYTGTEQVRGGRWAVGPWINPSSYFTNWADVPGFALYYNDNSSGRTFRIAGGVYYQYAYFQ